MFLLCFYPWLYTLNVQSFSRETADVPSITAHVFGNLFLKICPLFWHSHKKRKNSLETQAELAVRCVYVENQLYYKPSFSTIHQNVNKPKSRVVGLFMDLLFYLLVRQI